MKLQVIIALFLILWIIAGAISFYKFVTNTNNQKMISDLANKRIQASWGDYAYVGFVILTGGPLTWMVFFGVFIKRHL